MQLQRLVEKDIFASAAIAPTASGDSEMVTLDLGDRLSCQVVFDATGALTGATVSFYGSNDPAPIPANKVWTILQTATAITVDGSVFLFVPDVSFRYFKATKTIVAGDLTLKAWTLVKGGTA